jgi:hypothetical protein
MSSARTWVVGSKCVFVDKYRNQSAVVRTINKRITALLTVAVPNSITISLFWRSLNPCLLTFIRFAISLLRIVAAATIQRVALELKINNSRPLREGGTLQLTMTDCTHSWTHPSADPSCSRLRNFSVGFYEKTQDMCAAALIIVVFLLGSISAPFIDHKLPREGEQWKSNGRLRKRDELALCFASASLFWSTRDRVRTTKGERETAVTTTAHAGWWRSRKNPSTSRLIDCEKKELDYSRDDAQPRENYYSIFFSHFPEKV